ncbi:hypothetical protein DDF62_07035 [Caulobacter radicis]|uniref:hypothetical protein n=1 Tax=Caulobacter radicis TaxID=2172650 RepID=UPI000D56B606|nr:hypothetical protein [Caulobacter radicis]PVM91770.1 hypothetical protein DDF62_07035 [Caulobacter radicis]
MPYPLKVVLQAPLSAPDKLPAFVEQCVADRVELICVAGPMAEEIEDQIDWLVVGDGSDADRFIVTTAHPDEPLDRVISFATAWLGDGAAGASPEIVRL